MKLQKKIQNQIRKHLKKRSGFPEKRDAADGAGTERKKASGSPERNFSL